MQHDRTVGKDADISEPGRTGRTKTGSKIALLLALFNKKHEYKLCFK